ncbi:prepilin peptidase [Actinomadura violacea]|uniref:Prepilin peptidase n=1 Tax=Actinomadura violacea TaxID=2819934 RepID=A0ABS3RQC1_9ACTN|nr:A24 family peptidase [Actinomadura violacea]MBO2458852.1 prepilin peptidase [Actinomadura violacea]
MVAFVLVPLGFVTGLLMAPMAAPYTGDVPRRRRLLMAATTAAVYGLLGWRAGLSPVLPALLYLATVGTVLAFIDMRVKRLPDRFTLPSYGIAAVLLGAAAPFAGDGLSRAEHAVIGMAALFAIYAVQAFAVPSGIGLGDVKLSGVLGLCLGWFGQTAWVTGLLLTYLLGGCAAIAIMVVRRSRKGEFPFGPCMLAGTLVAVLAAAG